MSTLALEHNHSIKIIIKSGVIWCSYITVSKKINFKHSYDKSGKTTVTQQDLIFPNSDSVSIFCEDWSKETNFTDALRISIRTSRYKNFLSNVYN